MSGDYGIGEKTLLECVRREDVLRLLADGPTAKKEVQEVAGVSESTAYRLLGSFVEKGIAERVRSKSMSASESDSEGYRLTPVGETVLDETERFRETVGRVSCMGRVLSSTRKTEIEFDPSKFKHGIVTVSEEGKPYAPARRLGSMMDETEGVRLLTVSVSSTVFFARERRLEEEADVEVVCPEEVAESFVGNIEGGTGGIKDGFSVHIHEEPPLTVALFDKRVAVGAHDSESGTLEVLVDTGSRDAYGWGEEVYERYREGSEAYL
jgi:predicted transcriptional regulator